MRKAMKAWAPGDKLYHINRIHSKLISISKINKAVEYRNNNKKLAFELAINALIKNLECYNQFERNKRYNLYKQSLLQLKSFMSEEIIDANKVFNALCYSHGQYVRFYNKYKKLVSKFCEAEYHELVVPLFELEAKFIKRNKKAYSMNLTEE